MQYSLCTLFSLSSLINGREHRNQIVMRALKLPFMKQPSPSVHVQFTFLSNANSDGLLLLLTV